MTRAELEAAGFARLAEGFALLARARRAEQRAQTPQKPNIELQILNALPASSPQVAYARAGLPKPWRSAGAAWRSLCNRGIIKFVDGQYVEAAKQR